MRPFTAALVVLLTLAAFCADLSAQPSRALDDLLARATRYVVAYEQAFALLVSDELYVQEILRPPNPGTNLSRSNPGGGMLAGGPIKHQELRSDYMLVQLGDGAGWMPIRDVFQVNATKVRERDDRLVKLFQAGHSTRFEQFDRINEESARYNIGPVWRTINIPTLGMMFLHPRVRERFAFTEEGEDMVGPRLVVRLSYREIGRPTLIKTTRGRDLALTGNMWVDPTLGTVTKTELNAADTEVRAQVTVTFRLDEAVQMWVPAQMEEHYRAASSIDDIFATATYSHVRRFEVGSTKPPGR